MDTQRTLLEVDHENGYRQLIMQAAAGNQEDMLKTATDGVPQKSFSVVPEPGFCIKTKDEQGKKIFINLCKGQNLPCPRDISDQELVELLESDDPSGFRIPMSLGEPHAEADKNDIGCTAYDVVVNPDFFARIGGRDLLLGFVLTVVIEGLEQKYDIKLDREWKLLQNKKFMGTISEQNIRSQPKPWIMELDSDATTEKDPLIAELSPDKQLETKRAPEPPYTIMQEPADQYPEFLVAEIHLPKVKSAATVMVDIGEDRILLQTRSSTYYLDVFLPYNLIQANSAAQFNKKTKILTLTLPVCLPC